MEHLRYTPYGELRGRFDHAGEDAAKIYSNYEFTTYQSDMTSGLQYAGARWYDPEIGQFLNHDPKRQYASPYAYGPGDPVNGTDPNGETFGIDLLIAFVIGFIIGAVVSGVQAAVNGASVGQAFKAAAIGGAIGGALAVALPGLGNVIGATISTTAQVVYQVALVGYGAYSTVNSFENGQFVAGAFGAVMLAYSLYGMYQQADARVSARSQIKNLRHGEKFGMRFSGLPQEPTGLAALDSYLGEMIDGDILDGLGGVASIVRGTGEGILNVGTGLLTGNLGRVGSGLADLFSPVVPRLGSHGGLHHPGTRDNSSWLAGSGTKSNSASVHHDWDVGKHGFGASGPHANWIVNAWTGYGVEPGVYGQVYRIVGTAGFGLASGGLHVLGR